MTTSPRIALLLPIMLLLTSLGSAVAASQKIQSEAERDDWWRIRAAFGFPRFDLALQSTRATPMVVFAKQAQISSAYRDNPIWANAAPVADSSNWLLATPLSDFGHLLRVTPDATQTQKIFSSSSGSWTTPGNWTPTGVPTSSDDVLINAGNATMTLTASNLTIQYITFTDPNSRILENSTTTTTGSNLTLSGVDGSGNLINVSPVSGNPTFTIRNGSTADLNLILSTNGNLNVGFANASLLISSVISETGGSRSITKTGSGTLTLNGANTYSGGTMIVGGTLNLGNANALGSGGLTMTGGVLNFGDNPGSGNISLPSLSGTGGTIQRSGGNSSNTLTVGSSGANTSFAGLLTEVGNPHSLLSLTKIGSGTLTLSGANTYTGGTNINGGILALGSSGAIGLSGTISFGGGTLQYSADNTTDYSGRFSTSAGQQYKIDTNNQTVTYNTSLSSSGASLVKLGSGTLVLPTSNTYGSTTINSGTLEARVGSLVNVSGGITVNSGGTLLLSGTGRHIGNAVNVTLNGGTFNTGGLSEPGGTLGSQNIGALTLTSTSTINFGLGNSSVLEFAGVGTHTAGATLQITNWDGVVGIGGSGDRLLFNGLANSFLTAYNQTDVSFNGMVGYTTIQYTGMNNYFEVVGLAPVPEPSTWLAAALALGAMVWTQRRGFARKPAPVRIA